MKKIKNFWDNHKVLSILLLLVLLLVVIVIGVWNMRKPEKQNINFDISLEEDTTIDENASAETHRVELSFEETYAELGTTVFKDSGYTHYLILGVDGEGTSYAGKRGDAIKILSVNKKQGRVILTNIARDTYVYIEGKGWDKLTHAYAYGQAPLMCQTIEANLDIEIERYFVVNFRAVKNIVNMLGGIPMYVTQKESDCMTYMFNTPGTIEGNQILTGEQALAFCRIRKIDSDLKRTERQYRVLEAVYEKVREISPTKYPSLLAEVYDYVYTNASVGECLTLINTVINMDLAQLESYLLIDDHDADGKMLKNLNGTKTWYYVVKDMEQVMKDWREFLGVTNYKASPRTIYLSDHIKERFGTGTE